MGRGGKGLPKGGSSGGRLAGTTSFAGWLGNGVRIGLKGVRGCRIGVLRGDRRDEEVSAEDQIKMAVVVVVEEMLIVAEGRRLSANESRVQGTMLKAY